MPSRPPPQLQPRKRPRQARAAATLDILFEATIQVLLDAGVETLTTTRVAERAGVSVGSLYQYFPHKRALLYALNERYLDRLADTLEAACAARHGAPIAEMIAALVTTYWHAKTERADVTRVLYRSAADLDTSALIEAFAARADAATAAMFATASDARFVDLPGATRTLLTAIFGTVRAVFERDLPAAEAEDVHRQLIVMATAYVAAVASASDTGASVTSRPGAA